MKTLQNIKDDIAFENGFTDWSNLCFVWAGFAKQIEPYADEVAKRYAAEVAGEVILICEEHSTGLHKQDALAITLNLINELK